MSLQLNFPMSQLAFRAQARSPRPTDPLFRREMRERWRRPLTLLQLLIFASALAWLGYNIYYTTVPPGEFIGLDSMQGIGRGFFFALAKWHALAWIPGGLLLAAPTLCAERERGHLTDWVLAGLTPSKIVSAKWRALAGFVLVMACVPFPIFALCFPLGGVSPLDFVAVWALTIAIALNSVALGLLISANCATVTNALSSALLLSILALFLGVPLLPALFGESWLAPLTFGLTIIWLPIIWVTASATNFEVEVEKHIKNESEIRVETPLVPPPPQLAPQQQPRAPATAPVTASTNVKETIIPTTLAPFSQTEALILRATRGNAIAHRDVKQRFNARRVNAFYTDVEASNVALWVWVLGWLAAGVCGLLFCHLTNSPGAVSAVLLACLVLVLAPAMGFVALNAAPGFTRERAQKMLSALQMTALSPLDIVWGKIAGVLLLCAQFFGGALLSVCILALAMGPCSALMVGVFGVSCVVFTAMGSLTLSLWSRKTEIVALGALAGIAGLWWVLPTLFISNNLSLFFHAPSWLKTLWLAPISVILQPSNDFQLALALGQLSALCLGAALILGALCVRQLKRTRAEEAETGWLQRDLSRGWK